MTADSQATTSGGSVNPTGGEAVGLGEIPHDLFCQGCGYNLRTLTSGRCPECGHSLKTIRSDVPLIPWVHRVQIGRFRAYWKTVWLVMFRQQLFCEEMARPADFTDAQRFRWVTILHVYMPLLLATVGFYLVSLFRPPGPRPFGGLTNDLYNAAFTYVWPVGVVHVAVVLYLAAATGVPSYFFHPRGLPVELQNRAIALSYYACGPLAISALPVAAGFASYVIGIDNKAGMFLVLLAATVPCGQLVAWLLDLLHISRRIMPQFTRRTLLIAACTPTLWFLLAGLLLCGTLGFVLCILVIVVSLG